MKIKLLEESIFCYTGINKWKFLVIFYHKIFKKAKWRIFVPSKYFKIETKVWQCGGIVEWVPCSHVAHIYRGPRTESVHPPGGHPYQSSIVIFLLYNGLF